MAASAEVAAVTAAPVLDPDPDQCPDPPGLHQPPRPLLHPRLENPGKMFRSISDS